MAHDCDGWKEKREERMRIRREKNPRNVESDERGEFSPDFTNHRVVLVSEDDRRGASGKCSIIEYPETFDER